MEIFYCIHSCDVKKFRLYLNQTNGELCKKFGELNRSKKSGYEKFAIAVEAIKNNVANRHQWNREGTCDQGEIYAIKVDEHRFYTLVIKQDGYKELFISRYGRKQTQKNDKKLTDTIDSVKSINIQKQLS